MKNLILLTLILMASCGSGSEGTLNYPPSMPPEDEVPSDETPDGPPESYVFDPGGFNRTLSTRALYDAEEIEVFFTDAKVITEELSFTDVLTACIIKGATHNHSTDKVGLLSGIGKEQGYTRDFLLNPDVERTWHHSDGAIFTLIEANLKFEFDNPTATIDTCPDSDGNEVPCRRFMCGVDKTPEPVEVPMPPETLEIEIDGETVEVGTRNLYDAEEIFVFPTDTTIYVDPEPSFKYLLADCMAFAKRYDIDLSIVGLLNGAGKEDGYTKDFLLNPNVERTWSRASGTSSTRLEEIINADFDNPYATTKTCNDLKCKSFMCGYIKGE